MSKEKELLEARLEGFYEASEIFDDVIKRLQTSLNDYATIEYEDFAPPNGGQDKATFGHNTLTFLSSLFFDKLDETTSRLRWDLENE